MQRARGKIPNISEKEFPIDKFYGLNTFGPHAEDPPGIFRTLSNFDVYSGYIKERRGSVNFEDSSSLLNEGDIVAKAVFDVGDSEFIVVQSVIGGVSYFRFAELNSTFNWKSVFTKSETNPVQFSLSSTEKADMMVSNGKIYIFHTEGNSIFEYESSSNGIKRRKMGLPAPQIEEVQGDNLSTGILGKRVYSTELIYKDTTVTPNVDIIASGPNRALAVSNPLFAEGSLAYTPDYVENPLQPSEGKQSFVVKVSPVLNDGTGFEDDENSNWTHIRLHRSKDITTSTNATQGLEGETEITGRPDEMFQVQEMTRAAFLATLDTGFYYFAVDEIQDDSMPFPLTVIQESRLELIPIPAASTGTFVNNRVWASGVTALPGPGGDISVPDIEGKIFYSPETDTKYSESMSPLNAIESDPGDGQKMIKVIGFQEDVIGIKESKTGRIRQAEPDSGWVTEDETIGIEDKEFAQFVPGVGICARVNDQKDFRIFGYDLRWTNVFAGQLISRPIRDIISGYNAVDIDFIYINGKLMISGGEGQMLVLATEQQAGWSLYSFPFGSGSETLFTFSSGSRAMVVKSNRRPIEIEKVDSNGDYIATDYNPVSNQTLGIDLGLTTYKFQKNNGRVLIQERFISIAANASNIISITPYSDGKQWQPAFNLLPDPTEIPNSELRETEYQGYQAYKTIGHYVHYVISTVAPCTIYSIVLNALIQRGNINPNFDPFQVLSNVNTTPNWTKNKKTIIETGSASKTYTESGSATTTLTEVGS